MVSAYFSREALPQLANLFRQQSSEELMHAQKIVDYVTEAGGTVEVPAIPAGPGRLRLRRGGCGGTL